MSELLSKRLLDCAEELATDPKLCDSLALSGQLTNWSMEAFVMERRLRWRDASEPPSEDGDYLDAYTRMGITQITTLEAMPTLNAYIVSDGDSAVIVFDETARKAKVRGWQCHPGLPEYMDVRARRVSDEWKVFAREEGPHVVDDWGHLIGYSHDIEDWSQALDIALGRPVNPGPGAEEWEWDEYEKELAK